MIRRTWERLLSFLAMDLGLTLFQVLLVFVVFVLPAFGETRVRASFAADAAFSALLTIGAFTLPERRWMRYVVPPVAALALLMRWWDAAGTVDVIVVRDLATLVTLILFATVVGGQTYRSGPVTSSRIKGAVSEYLLLGLIWASAYELLYHTLPGAFTGNLDDAFLPQTWIYFSFVTLTTTGYGDILPIHPIARSLAMAEAVTGQLYIAITLARLVALHVSTHEKP